MMTANQCRTPLEVLTHRRFGVIEQWSTAQLDSTMNARGDRVLSFVTQQYKPATHAEFMDPMLVDSEPTQAKGDG